LGEEGDIAAVYGAPTREVIRLPLMYQSKITGYLEVAYRAPGESFSPLDLRLLENIARQAGAAAHAAKLTTDLRHSRQRLVTAREEERRRFRRDLHDGLGPTLASLTLKLDAIRNLMRDDPDKADILLSELKTQTRGTIQDIRELVYDLRPPALDELGLIGAIQSFIEAQQSEGLKITLDTPKSLPNLPAAFEVALYRIALEGITNTIRHANANQATIRIYPRNDHNLVIDIIDDGTGLPKMYPTGVGLASMRERAEELGGTFEIVSRDQGLHIRACFSLQED